MNTVLYKALGILALVVTVALIIVFGVRQYGNSRVAAQELSTVKEAVSEAVLERKTALNTDVAQAKQNAVLRDSVRSTVNQARKRDAEIPSSGCDAVGDSERLRLLNVAISAVNSDVQRAGELPL